MEFRSKLLSRLRAHNRQIDSAPWTETEGWMHGSDAVRARMMRERGNPSGIFFDRNRSEGT